MKKAVIFDHGGVVVGKVPFMVTASDGKRIEGDSSLERVAKEFDVSYELLAEETAADIRRLQKGEIKESQIWDAFINKHMSDYKLPTDYLQLLQRGYGEICPENSDIISIINKLKTQGIVVGLLSNTVESHTKYNEDHGRFSRFDPVVLSCRVDARKPETEIYQILLRALEKKNIKSEDVIYVDDVEEFLVPAKSLGMKTICFRSGIDDASKLKDQLIKLGFLE